MTYLGHIVIVIQSFLAKELCTQLILKASVQRLDPSQQVRAHKESNEITKSGTGIVKPKPKPKPKLRRRRCREWRRLRSKKPILEFEFG